MLGYAIEALIVAGIAWFFARNRADLPWHRVIRNVDCFGGANEVLRHASMLLLWITIIEAFAHAGAFALTELGPTAAAAIYRSLEIQRIPSAGPMTIWSTTISLAVAMCLATRSLVEQMARNPPVNLLDAPRKKDIWLAIEHVGRWKLLYKFSIVVLAHVHAYFFDRAGLMASGACTLIIQEFRSNTILRYWDHFRIQLEQSNAPVPSVHGRDDNERVVYIVTMLVRDYGYRSVRSRLNVHMNHNRKRPRHERVDMASQGIPVSIDCPDLHYVSGTLGDVSVDGRGLSVICKTAIPRHETPISIRVSNQSMMARYVYCARTSYVDGEECHRIGLEVLHDAARISLLTATGIQQQHWKVSAYPGQTRNPNKLHFKPFN